VRITPLRGPGAALLKCPACRLKCRPTAIGPDGACPSCGHERLLRVDVLRGRIAPAVRPGSPSDKSGEQVGP
jgi:DNA-directed RNA polymerase subunit RPC12/RpoP